MCDTLRNTLSRGRSVGAGDPLALPQLNAMAAIVLVVLIFMSAYFAPVLPAFFFSTSPV